jgi:hypothetical protein
MEREQVRFGPKEFALILKDERDLFEQIVYYARRRISDRRAEVALYFLLADRERRLSN